LTGVITGAVALSQAGELKDGCRNKGCPPALHDTLATHEALTLTSTITFVAGGVFAAAGGVGWIIDATTGDDGVRTTAWFTGTGFALERTW